MHWVQIYEIILVWCIVVNVGVLCALYKAKCNWRKTKQEQLNNSYNAGYLARVDDVLNNGE